MALGRDIHFWRQTLVLFSDYINSFGVGFFLSFPVVINQAISSLNSTGLKVTSDQASWIVGSQGITGILGFLIMPAIMQIFGRKTAYFVTNGPVSLGFIVFFFASNITCLYIACLIQGLALSGIFITSIILAEYSTPKRRGYFMSIKKSGLAFGSLVCHSLSAACAWRKIALIGALPNLVSIVLAMLWPESPAYLAMKGRFEECDKCYTWLNGNSLQSRKDLEKLISAQTKTREKMKQDRCLIRRVLKSIPRKDFQKPFVISTLLTIVVESCGRYYNLAYIVQIMTNVVNDNSVSVYCALGSDLVTLISLWCSCFLITYLKRRQILLYFGFGSVTLMLFICLSIFLKNRNYLCDWLFWLPPIFIVVNTFVTNLGVLPVCFTISGEIFPLEYRGLGTCFSGITFSIIYGVVLKCTPLLMEIVGVEGIYGAFAMCLFICLIILHFILIETKDKTLQDIENEVKGTEINNELLIE